MPRTWTRWILGASAGTALAWSGTASAAGVGLNVAGSAAPPEQQQAVAERLSELHTGALALLRIYATQEALITATDRGRPENQAFWVGASSVVPGVGQMINADYVQGSLLLFASGLSEATRDAMPIVKPQRAEAQGLMPAYYAANLLRDGIMMYAMLHATNASYRAHRDRTAAMWTGTASVVPGVGQAINGDWWSAAGLLVAWGALTAVSMDLEKSIFISDAEQKQWARDPQSWTCSVALLPAGAGLQIFAEW